MNPISAVPEMLHSNTHFFAQNANAIAEVN